MTPSSLSEPQEAALGCVSRMANRLQCLLSYRPPSWTRTVCCAFSLICILSFYTSRYEGSFRFTRFLTYGEAYEPKALPAVKTVPRVVVPGSGFDGQFYATIATDPSLTSPGMAATMDQPEYRSRRVLLSAAAYVAGAGNPERIMFVYCVLNGLFWASLALLLLYSFRPSTIQEYIASMTLIFSAGVFESVRFAVTDLPAAVFLIAAALHRPLSTVLCCAAGLTRETGLLAVGLLLPSELRGRKEALVAGLRIAAAVAPFLAWALYVHWRFPSALSSYGAFSFPLVAMVLTAAISAYRALAELSLAGALMVLTAFSMTVQALYFACSVKPRSALWRMATPFALMYAILGPAVWSGRYNVIRICLPLTAAFCMDLARESPRRFIVWWVPGMLACMVVRSG